MFAIGTENLDANVNLILQLNWLIGQPIFWAVLGIVVGPYLFYLGFLTYRRRRLILDIPRSSTRSAAIGSVEIAGKAIGPYTLVSPLSERECLYYRVVLRVAGNHSSPIIEEACAPLFLDDGSGEILIFPRGAEMQLASFDTGGGEHLTSVLSRRGYESADLVDAREYCILPNDELFVLGSFRENSWAKLSPGDTSLSRVGPGFVSLAEADLLRREAFPCLDSKVPSGCAGERKFDLYPPAIVMEGESPFIISTQSQRDVVAHLAWKSIFFIWGGPLWTLWSLWTMLHISRILNALLGHPK